MKKIFLSGLLALAVTGVNAASVTVEGQNISGVNGTQDATNYGITYRESINKNFAADIGMNQTQSDQTKSLSTRLEAGLTSSTRVGPVGLYLRTAVGEKYISAANFSYYSVEPGVTAPIAKTGLTARLGYRYRDSFDGDNNDKTETVRVGLGYDINKTNNIGVRFDRMRGDSDANVWAVNYTRSF